MTHRLECVENGRRTISELLIIHKQVESGGSARLEDGSQVEEYTSFKHGGWPGRDITLPSVLHQDVVQGDAFHHPHLCHSVCYE